MSWTRVSSARFWATEVAHHLRVVRDGVELIAWYDSSRDVFTGTVTNTNTTNATGSAGPCRNPPVERNRARSHAQGGSPGRGEARGRTGRQRAELRLVVRSHRDRIRFRVASGDASSHRRRCAILTAIRLRRPGRRRSTGEGPTASAFSRTARCRASACAMGVGDHLPANRAMPGLRFNACADAPDAAADRVSDQRVQRDGPRHADADRQRETVVPRARQPGQRGGGREHELRHHPEPAPSGGNGT